jgi:hypothetical protein
MPNRCDVIGLSETRRWAPWRSRVCVYEDKSRRLLFEWRSSDTGLEGICDFRLTARAFRMAEP